jgi:AcrR family transcriptional regulator
MIVELRYDQEAMARPRSETARQAALEATVETLLTCGVEGVTFDGIAAASGVAKTTLYRHFGSKQAMIAAAAASQLEELPTPDTGDLLEDLRTIFSRWKSDPNKDEPDVLSVLLGAADTDPELHRLLMAMLDERRRPVRTVLQLAQLRGEIGADVDLDIVLALLGGPFVQRKLVDKLEITDEFRDAVITQVVSGLRADASSRTTT